MKDVGDQHDSVLLQSSIMFINMDTTRWDDLSISCIRLYMCVHIIHFSPMYTEFCSDREWKKGLLPYLAALLVLSLHSHAYSGPIRSAALQLADLCFRHVLWNTFSYSETVQGLSTYVSNLRKRPAQLKQICYGYMHTLFHSLGSLGAEMQ